MMDLPSLHDTADRATQRVTQAVMGLRPTLRVKTAHAVLLAVALTLLAGFSLFLTVRGVLHVNALAGVTGVALLYMSSREGHKLVGWWRANTRTRIRFPIPIGTLSQLLIGAAAGIIVLWLRALISAWLKT